MCIDDNESGHRKITARCSCCGRVGVYELSEAEADTLRRYRVYGRQLGYIQELFPKVPAWIRSGAIDLCSDGFCICPDCCG